jgi:hypothetical protein
LPEGNYYFELGVPKTEGAILGQIEDMKTGVSASFGSSGSPAYCSATTCFYSVDIALTAASPLDVYFIDFRLPNDRGNDGYVFQIVKA